MDGGRLRRDVQPGRQLRVAQPFGEERHDLSLARRERVGPGDIGPDAETTLDRVQIVDPPASPVLEELRRLLDVGTGVVGPAQAR